MLPVEEKVGAFPNVNCCELQVSMYQTECTWEGILEHSTVQIKCQKDFNILENRESQNILYTRNFVSLNFQMYVK